MKHVTLSVADAMASPKLFQPFFTGPSWDTWRAVVKAMFAERMSAAEIETFRSTPRQSERFPHAKPETQDGEQLAQGPNADRALTACKQIDCFN